jgi:HlyD family secretion protein
MDTPTPDARLQTAPGSPEQAPKDRPPASTRILIVSVAAAAVAGLSIWYLLRPQPPLVRGEVDATRLDIAGRVDGRVADIPVVREQNVAAGAVRVRIDNTETIAKNEQSLAAKIVTNWFRTRNDGLAQSLKRQISPPVWYPPAIIGHASSPRSGQRGHLRVG